MRKVSALMAEYYDKQIQGDMISEGPFRITQKLPITPRERSKWVRKSSPNRLCREYELKEDDFNNFVADLLDMQMDMQHHASIKLEYPKIIIEVLTHGIMDVTEVDKKWARTAEEIYRGYKNAGND
jgi:pterin-4a-carbinolamine dehydratase